MNKLKVVGLGLNVGKGSEAKGQGSGNNGWHIATVRAM